MRILMISESARVRQRSLAALRARDDVQILEALSAAEGHERAREGVYDLLLIDGDMRPEGGFSFLYELRAHGELEGVAVPPAIILVAREDDRWLARWAGAAEAYVKPVDPFFLAARIGELAGKPGGAVPESAGETVGQSVAMDSPPELDAEDAPDEDADVRGERPERVEPGGAAPGAAADTAS